MVRNIPYVAILQSDLTREDFLGMTLTDDVTNECKVILSSICSLISSDVSRQFLWVVRKKRISNKAKHLTKVRFQHLLYLGWADNLFGVRLQSEVTYFPWIKLDLTSDNTVNHHHFFLMLLDVTIPITPHPRAVIFAYGSSLLGKYCGEFEMDFRATYTKFIHRRLLNNRE